MLNKRRIKVQNIFFIVFDLTNSSLSVYFSNVNRKNFPLKKLQILVFFTVIQSLISVYAMRTCKSLRFKNSILLS